MALKLYNPKRSRKVITDKDIEKIFQFPHLLGHMLGKDLLTVLHSLWIKYIWQNGDESRSIQAHRGSYKTTAITALGSLWWMLFHPNDTIGIIRKTFTDAALVVRTIMQMMEMNEAKDIFRYVNGYYPEFKIRREGMLEFNFKNKVTPEGNVNAYGLDAGLTGKHLDKIIMDDFVTLKDRISKAEREKTKLLLQEVSTNIINQGQAACYIGTPWHRNDGWELCPPPVKFNVHECDILNEKQISEKQLKTTPSLYAANYLLQYLSDEGQLFSDVNYRRWSYRTHNVVAHWDAAYKGSDTNALTFFSMQSDKSISGIGYHNPGHAKDWLDFVVDKYKKLRAKRIHIENNSDKGWMASELKKRGCRVDDYHEGMNKHMKITTHLYKSWNNIFWDEEMTDEEYLEQITDYREGEEPDDAPDSAASLIRDEFSCSKRNVDALYES